MKKLYLCVTEDKYEFPIAIADTPAELSKMVGASRSSILACLCRLRSGDYHFSRYREVEVEDD